MPKYFVAFWGDLEIEANSDAEAESAAIEQLKQEPENVLFWDAALVISCRFCGCTEEHACEGGCAWANPEKTVCTAPACLAHWTAEIRAGSLALSAAEVTHA